jgi:hypothetical protein
MSRSSEQPPRWPKRSRSRPLALRPEDFEPPRARRGPSDLQKRIDGWARGVVERLDGLHVVPTTTAAPTTQADSSRVRFAMRGATPPREASSLLLGVGPSGIRAGLELPATQARAARARLSDPARALALATALEALPEQFAMGASTDESASEAPRASADDVRALLDRVERDQGSLWIGWTVPRELALEHVALLDEQLADALVALAQVFALLVAAPPEGERTSRTSRTSTKGWRFSGRRGSPEEGRADEERDGGRGRPPRARARALDREREPAVAGSARGNGLPGEGEPDAESPAREALLPRTRDARAPLRPPGRRRPVKVPQVAAILERGARVRVLKGPFSGKVGVVHELDGKGGARVMLGLLAVRLEVNNLVPAVEGRGRPVLSSSHRKPIPARS